MNMKTKRIALIGSTAALAATAFSQSPSFPTGYYYSSSTRFVRSDYMLDTSDGVIWFWDGPRDEHGLRVKALDPPAYLQHRRRFVPAEGVTARAKFRVRFDHVENDEAKFGFYSETADPFDTEPDNGAYFYQKLGWTDDGCHFGEVWARVTSSSGTSEAKLFTYQEDQPPNCDLDTDVYDMMVEIIGTSTVLFHWKPATDATFSTHTFTENNLPSGGMHFSASRLCINASLGYSHYRVFEWEVVEE